MSGITGSCIVCGKFHATGHIGDRYAILEIEGRTVLACPGCIPYAPVPDWVGCSICGAYGVVVRYPDAAYGGKHQQPWVCGECDEAQRHHRLHEHMDVQMESR